MTSLAVTWLTQQAANHMVQLQVWVLLSPSTSVTSVFFYNTVCLTALITVCCQLWSDLMICTCRWNVMSYLIYCSIILFYKTNNSDLLIHHYRTRFQSKSIKLRHNWSDALYYRSININKHVSNISAMVFVEDGLKQRCKLAWKQKMWKHFHLHALFGCQYSNKRNTFLLWNWAPQGAAMLVHSSPMKS